MQTNLGGSPVPFIVAYHVLDRWGRKPSDVEGRSARRRTRPKAALEMGKQRSQEARVKDVPPSHPLDAYVGQYGHPGYGTVTIGRNEDGLTFGYHGETFPLPHYHYDIFEWTEPISQVRFPVSFGTALNGDIDRLWLALEPTMPPAEYSHVPDSAMWERSFLERFAGTYELMGREMVISLEGEHGLIVAIPGLSRRDLEPYRDTTFRLKEMSGYTLEFQLEEGSSVVKGVVLTTPTGVFDAARKT